MTSINTKICKFNYTCTNKNCLYKHSTDIKDRKIYKEIYFNIYDSSKYSENHHNISYCNEGLLCENESCLYKHICNYNCRILVKRAYDKYKMTYGMSLWQVKNELNELTDKYDLSNDDINIIKLIIEKL